MKSLGYPFKSLLSLSLIILISSSAFAKSHKHRHHHHVSQTVSSQPIYGIDNLISVVNQAIAGVDSDAAIGIQIKSMKQGDTLYSRNEQRSFTPASTMKIFTAEAALLYLGPDYTFPTRVLTDAKSMNGGYIDGDIYLVQSGDPSLTYYDLLDLMVALKAQQIQGINGNVYIDNSAYDQSNFGPGWKWEDTRYCYSAPINASIINHNCVSFGIAPAKTAGNLANIIESPRYFYANIKNSVVTKSYKSKSCYIHLNAQTDNTIALTGCMPKGRYTRGASVVIANVDEYNKSLVKNLFKRYGIQVNGQITTKTAPSDLSVLASHQSKPLHILVSEMLKMSDNIIAGSLFKKLGELYNNQPGSWANGSIAVKQILSGKAGVDTSHLTILDGSGLSQQNQVTPAAMMQLLDSAFHNYATNYEFISALPVAGIDGTLKHRLGNVTRKIRAKTGTMSASGVISLAGYAINKDKEPIAFVIIVNGRKGNVWQYREMEDKIVTALANYSRG